MWDKDDIESRVREGRERIENREVWKDKKAEELREEDDRKGSSKEVIEKWLKKVESFREWKD